MDEYILKALMLFTVGHLHKNINVLKTKANKKSGAHDAFRFSM